MLIFEKFKSTFGIFPNLLLKNEREIFKEEIKKEENILDEVQPWCINLSAIEGILTGRKKMDSLFSIIELQERFKKIEKNIKDTFLILCEWANWAKDYPLNQKIIKFRIIEAFCVSQMGEFDSKFIAEKGRDINFKEYVSIKTLGYAWFYKFVSDGRRKLHENDVVDILNISAINYCDVYIGENNMIDIINKMKRELIVGDVKVVKASSLLSH